MPEKLQIRQIFGFSIAAMLLLGTEMTGSIPPLPLLEVGVIVMTPLLAPLRLLWQTFAAYTLGLLIAFAVCLGKAPELTPSIAVGVVICSFACWLCYRSYGDLPNTSK